MRVSMMMGWQVTTVEVKKQRVRYLCGSSARVLSVRIIRSPGTAPALRRGTVPVAAPPGFFEAVPLFGLGAVPSGLEGPESGRDI